MSTRSGRDAATEAGTSAVAYSTSPAVLGAFEGLQEVVVEEEDPHVPVGDERERRTVAVGVRVRAEQPVVVRVEVGLFPDAGALEHAHGARPFGGVGARLVDMRVQP